ncbi:MAG: NAD-dependent epimerase/dehydratase family protein [Nanoarchaeota archaeon]
MQKAIITGGAGYIGSNLADFLLKQSWTVKVVDNFFSGKMNFIEHNLKNPNFSYEKVDLKDSENVEKSFSGNYDIVFHFAANADVKGGAEHPTLDLEEGCIPISNVLEAMRKNNIKKVVFSSTGSIYGEPKIFPTPENAPFPIQTSMYGAAKLYGEGLIQSYCESFGMQAWIYRFVSILGERYTHGVVFSFYKQLMDQKDKEQKELVFLSDGTPLKSYLYVGDCIKGIWHGLNNSNEKVNIFNLGTDEEMSVKKIADIVVERMNLNEKVNYKYGAQQRGWIGDSPHIRLDITKLRNLGWEPQLTIKEAILKTIGYLEENEWVINENYFREKY